MVKIIQNYTLNEQIGEGQYGKVYRGIDNNNGKQVAVKVINVKKFKQNPKLEQCTLNEIDALSKIDSPYIVQFKEILKTVNNFYFFYEFCNEGTLEQFIKKNGVLSEHKTLQFFEQLIEAFKILNAKNIMHRDLKPSNILVHNGKIKIGDFGFCKSLQTQKDLAQTMLGSPIYMAPEVLKGQIYTIKADIWSLGVCLYEMLYGFCPFQQSSIARLINVLDNQEVRFNRDINKVSPNLEELIKKLLVKDHFKRISWNQIFQYKFKNGTLIKSQTQFDLYNNRRVLGELNKQQIRQNNFINQKNQKQKQNKSPLNPKMFKKKTSPISHNIETTYTEPFELKSSNSEIQNLKMHQRIVDHVRIVNEFIKDNLHPEITCKLAVKLYELILNQHYRLTTKRQYIRERAELSQIIKSFQNNQSVYLNEREPLLTQYIKFVQNLYQRQFSDSTFSSDDKIKKIIAKCLSLLDFNNLKICNSTSSYQNMAKSKLLSELKQRMIHNTI